MHVSCSVGQVRAGGKFTKCALFSFIKHLVKTGGADFHYFIIYRALQPLRMYRRIDPCPQPECRCCDDVTAAATGDWLTGLPAVCFILVTVHEKL